MVISKLPVNPSDKKIMAFIPARGGSKGIPRKNIVDLGGKPLIWHTLRVARQSKYINRVIVSTEDAEIAEIARSCGGEVPFLRPRDLSQDRSCMGDSLDFTLRKLEDEEYIPDIVITMFPTSPFRETSLVDGMIEAVMTRCTISISVREIDLSRKMFISPETNGRVALSDVFTYSRKAYLPIGVASVRAHVPHAIASSPTRLAQYHLQKLEEDPRRYFFKKCEPRVVTSPLALIDINTPDDLLLAREIVKQGLYSPEHS